MQSMRSSIEIHPQQSLLIVTSTKKGRQSESVDLIMYSTLQTMAQDSVSTKKHLKSEDQTQVCCLLTHLCQIANTSQHVFIMTRILKTHWNVVENFEQETIFFHQGYFTSSSTVCFETHEAFHYTKLLLRSCMCTFFHVFISVLIFYPHL